MFKKKICHLYQVSNEVLSKYFLNFYRGFLIKCNNELYIKAKLIRILAQKNQTKSISLKKIYLIINGISIKIKKPPPPPTPQKSK